MKKITKLLCLFSAAAFVAFSAVSCSNDDPTTGGTEQPDNDNDDDNSDSTDGAFLVVTEVDDIAYILASDNLDDGSVTIVGNGNEVETAGVWYYIDNNTLWSIKDVGGNDPAAVHSYIYDGTKKTVTKVDDFATTKYNSWGHLGSSFAYMAYLSSSDNADYVVNGDNTYYAVTLCYTVAGGSLSTPSFSTMTAEGYLLQDSENPSPETVNFPGYAEAGGKVYVSIATQGVSKYATMQDNFTSAMETLIENEGLGGVPSDYVANGSGIAYGINKDAAVTSGFTTSYKISSGVPFPLTPDKVRIAVYDANNYDLDSAPEAFITSDLMGQAYGRYIGNPYNTIAASDKYVYVFSPGATRKFDDVYAVNNGKSELITQYDVDSTTATDWIGADELDPLRKATSVSKAGVMRIAAGSKSFDTSFGSNGLVDIETQLNGYTFTKVWHIDGERFLLRVMTESTTAESGYYGFHKYKPVDCGFVVFDGSTQTITPISGLPTYAEIRDDNGAIGEPCAYDGKVYIPYSKDSHSAVYVADVSTTASSYTAVEGKKIVADNILGVGFLRAQ